MRAEHGVIMTGGSIQAILSGVKTMTRRLPGARWLRVKPGDLLWVRETWQAVRQTNIEYDEWEVITRAVRRGERWGDWVTENGVPAINYRADDVYGDGQWTPAIHMPRWASRITLKVTAVRSELLQDITEEDAIAEGVNSWPGLTGHLEDVVAGPARARFFELWDTLHSKATFSTNPVVKVISFNMAERKRNR